ncbi:MAG: lipid II:glycine glycyltransferase FemX [Thermoleophilia bacterium]
MTALGVRRRVPLPGRAFWEFNNGPTFLETTAFDDWLAWLDGARGHDVARLRLQPAMLLDERGDETETILEQHGFVRHRAIGTWATLLVDLSVSEEQLLATFRPQTRARIRKSRDLGIDISGEDTPQGWSVLCDLEAEMARTLPVRSIDVARLARMNQHWTADKRSSTVLVARHTGEPLAAAQVIAHGSIAYLSMLPSSRRNEKLPSSHLLVWEAMRWAKRSGCTTFDFAGYSLAARPGDPLWGVNSFKHGFARGQRPSKFVAVHEKDYSPLIAASASAARRSERWARRLFTGATK